MIVQYLPVYDLIDNKHEDYKTKKTSIEEAEDFLEFPFIFRFIDFYFCGKKVCYTRMATKEEKWTFSFLGIKIEFNFIGQIYFIYHQTQAPTSHTMWLTSLIKYSKKAKVLNVLGIWKKKCDIWWQMRTACTLVSQFSMFTMARCVLCLFEMSGLFLLLFFFWLECAWIKMRVVYA